MTRRTAYYRKWRVKILAREKQRYHANRSEFLARQKRYYQRHKLEIRAASHRKYAKLTHVERTAIAWRHKLRLYNLTDHGYRTLLRRQHNRCAACKKKFGTHNESVPCVDHDRACCSGARSCGRCVRGLLCRRCNRLLGVIERNSKLFSIYLKERRYVG